MQNISGLVSLTQQENLGKEFTIPKLWVCKS